MIHRYSRELSVAASIVVLCLILAVLAPGYFARENLLDMLLANIPVLIVAVGMTFVILTAQIDISVGSLFAVCGVAAGVFAKAGLPVPVVVLAACLSGAVLGAVNGGLVAYRRVPSIVVTLAAIVALRDPRVSVAGFLPVVLSSYCGCGFRRDRDSGGMGVKDSDCRSSGLRRRF
jgi:rhamnose transport system permease protein